MPASLLSTIEKPPLAPIAPAATLPQWLRQRARQWPDATALVCGISGSRYSHAALHHLVGRCAAGLAAQGFGPGAVLLMVAPNAPEWAIAALAAMAAGGAVGAAHPASSATELASRLHAVGARYVFTTPALLASVRGAVAGAPGLASAGLVQTIVLGEADDTLAFTTLLACADAEPRPPAGIDSLALLPLSPDAARAAHGKPLTQRALLHQLAPLQRSHPLGPGDLALALLPMGQLAAFVQATLSPLAQGAAVVTLPTFERTLVDQTIAKHRITHLLRAPPQQGLIASRTA